MEIQSQEPVDDLCGACRLIDFLFAERTPNRPSIAAL